MAKRVIWSLQAQSDRKFILQYWIDRNQSATYSRKLNLLFQEAIKLIAQHPHIGVPTELENVRSKLVREYQIFYEETETTIHLLAIWDTRQDPDKLLQK